MALIIVSNRLPFRIAETISGYQMIPSIGGLATGLGSFYMDYKAEWIGWPGEIEKNEKVVDLLAKHNCFPIFLPRKLVRGYYRGFSNKTIWPLFHGFTTYAVFSRSDWESYREVNSLFADKVEEMAKPGDKIWIHDYHLMLLPKMLRERNLGISIGFFLHIPFPSYDIFRLLPWRKKLIEGILGADLIGFHTYDYAQSFLEAVARIMGYENKVDLIEVGERLVQVDVFPMGIDFERFSKTADSSEVKEEVERIKRRVGKRRIILSMSRLDYTKGPLHHLMAFEGLLKNHPEWREKVTYIFVVSPSREEVEHYSQLKAKIDGTIGKINGKYGILGWVPVWYMYRYLDFRELVALYSVADVALILPISDGMNLMAKEYLASMNHLEGALVISETAGAAKELLEAFKVNPNNIEEVSETIDRALKMEKDELRRRNKAMRERIKKFNVRYWADSFLNRLDEVVERTKDLEIKILSNKIRDEIIEAYRRARNPLLILDYDGTLVPIVDEPKKAKPTEGVKRLLSKLSKRGKVVVISGRDRFSLDDWLGDLEVTLVAEHGGWTKIGGKWRTTAPIDISWKNMIRPLLNLFVRRIPGSFVEEKDFSLAWHYRKADLRIAREAVREIVHALMNLTAGINVIVLAGKMVVEVKQAGINKGNFFRSIANEGWDFILAAGDDAADESLFSALPDQAYSLRIGYAATSARYSLRRREDLIDLLEKLAGG